MAFNWKKQLQKLDGRLLRTPYVGAYFCRVRHRRSVKDARGFERHFNTALLAVVVPNFPSEIEFVIEDCFPPNAWQLTLSDQECKVRYGRNIERNGTQLFEGVWAGDFEDFAFLDSDNLYGTGLEIGETVRVAASTHMFECLFLMQDKTSKAIIVGNSLANSIAGASPEIHGGWLKRLTEKVNAVFNEQTAKGAFAYSPKIYEDENAAIYSLFFHNFNFKRGCPPTVTLRIDDQYFDGFAAYQRFIQTTLWSVLENGRSSKRQNAGLGALSCISSGYDSTAATAIGASIGINETITLDLIVGGSNDSGVQIAQELGVNCLSFIHPAGHEIPILAMEYTDDLLEIAWEFVGTAGFGDDILFAAFENVLPSMMMLDGKLGDGIWSKNSSIRSGMPTDLPYSKSMNEFRLRVGFAQIPLPSIGAQFPESIKKISLSKEMDPWRIGGRYDRPIPRRIVETAGATRTSFGQEKKAASPNAKNREELRLAAITRMMARYKVANA